MKRFLICILLGFIGWSAVAQNNYIVKTDDGRRVLLKADYTWEYIDLVAPKANATSKEEESKKTAVSGSNEVLLKTSANQCQLGLDFEEPKLNPQVQAYLKRNRSSINQLKKKVAGKEKCDESDIKLISTTETKIKGTYTFCTCKGKVTYKRNRSSFYKKSKLF